MAKVLTTIGFWDSTVETAPSVLSENIVERPYYGEITRQSNRWSSADKVNDDLNISNVVSILADAFAFHNFYTIRYIVLYNSKWKVTNVEVQAPRLILTIGGLWNE